MFRGVRLTVVVALLAGSLMLASTGAAEATTFGPLDDWSVSWEYSGSGGVACNGVAGWVIDAAENHEVKGKITCKATGASGAAFGGFDEGSFVKVYFKAHRVGLGAGMPGPGPICDVSGGENGIEYAIEGNPATAQFTIPGSPGCHVTEVCTRVEHVRDGLLDNTYNTKCTGIQIGESPTEVPEPPPASCGQGDFLPPTGWDSDGEGTTGYPSYLALSRARFMMTPGSGYTAGQGWNTYVYLANGYVTGGTPVNGNNGGWYTNGAGLTDADGDGPLLYLPEAIDASAIVGIGVYATGATYGNGQPGLPQSVTNGRIGISDPSVCSFYWGTKVASTVGDDLDEPWGALPFGGVTEPDTTPDEPDDETDDGCGFSFTDPGSWASAGICELVGLIRQLINAVEAVADAVVSGIMRGLRALFLPSNVPDFGSISMPTLSTWVPEVPDLSAGSCGAITLPPLDFGMAGDTASRTWVNTCTGPWPEVRLYTYNGLLALVLAGIVRAMFRAVMTGLGMAVEAGAEK